MPRKHKGQPTWSHYQNCGQTKKHNHNYTTHYTHTQKECTFLKTADVFRFVSLKIRFIICAGPCTHGFPRGTMVLLLVHM